MKKLAIIAACFFCLISCKKEIGTDAPEIAVKKGVYVIGDQQGSILYSRDMKTFERITYQSPTFSACRVYFKKNQFWLFDNYNQIFGNQCLFTSSDALTWDGKKSNNAIQHPNTIVPLGDKWVRLIPGIETSISSDGINWQSYPTPNGMEKRIWERYYTKGDTIFMYSGWDQDNYVNFSDLWMTTDGITWTELFPTFPANVHSPEFAFTSFKGKSYAVAQEQIGIGIHGAETRLLVADDGYHWQKVSSTTPLWASNENLRYNNTLFNYKGKLYLAGGIASEAGPSWYKDVWSFDGISWQKEADDISETFQYGFASIGEGKVVVVE